MNQNTLDLMKQMKLTGMINAFRLSLESGETEKLTPDEFISHLIQSEWDERQNRSIKKKIQIAKFRYKAAIEDIYFGKERNLEKNQVQRFADCTFIENYENILITGSTGIGKSYLASAIGYNACSLGYRVAYFSSPKLFSKLKVAKADGSYIRELARIEKVDLLVIDDFGLQPLDSLSRAILMELIEDRHGKSSLIITAQVPVSLWYEIIGEQTIADAIMDRIIHQSHRLELKGESLRKKEKSIIEKSIEIN